MVLLVGWLVWFVSWLVGFVGWFWLFVGWLVGWLVLLVGCKLPSASLNLVQFLILAPELMFAISFNAGNLALEKLKLKLFLTTTRVLFFKGFFYIRCCLKLAKKLL